MKKATAVFSFVFFLSFMTVSVYADWKITLSTTSPDGESSESTFYLKDGKLKQSTGPLDIIIDLEQNTLLFVNNAGKSYWEGTKEDFEGEMESFMREMMGEDGYKQYKEMAGLGENKNESQINIMITPENEEITIAGFSGKKFTIMVDDQLVEEVWLCKEIDAMNDFDFTELEGMFDPEGPMDHSSTEAYNTMMLSGGFPIKEISYSYGSKMEETQLVDAQNITLDGDLFTKPADYTKGGIMEIMMGAMGGMGRDR